MFYQSLIPGRSEYVGPAGSSDVALTDREFLEKSLADIKRRRGLIHGDLNDGGRVCALGALAKACGGTVTVTGCLPREMQEFNDSMPKATPAKRRERVIQWLEKRIAKLPRKPS